MNLVSSCLVEWDCEVSVREFYDYFFYLKKCVSVR